MSYTRNKNTYIVGVLVLISFTPVALTQTLDFSDGFENIAVGDYPDENGWLRAMVGGTDAVVSDDRSFSGTRSFRFIIKSKNIVS